MSVNPSSMQTHQSFSEFLSTHQGLVIGGGVVLALVLGGIMLRGKQTTLPATTTGGDLTGLTGGRVYVPTSTSFETQNIRYGPLSNDPNLTTATVTGSFISTDTTTKTVNPPAGVCQAGYRFQSAALGAPIPSGSYATTGGYCVPTTTSTKGLIWDKRYTIRTGETLSAIAASLTRTLRAQGMPDNMTIVWADLYGHNASQIDAVRRAHGDTVQVSAQSTKFFGMTITVPRWG